MARTRHAFTLIEVVASLALIATTAGWLMTAHSRSLLRLRTARQQAVATQIAEELIARWRLEPAGAMIDAEGEVAYGPGWLWHRRVQPSNLTRNLKSIEVTLTVQATKNDAPIVRYVWLRRLQED